MLLLFVAVGAFIAVDDHYAYKKLKDNYGTGQISLVEATSKPPHPHMGHKLQINASKDDQANIEQETSTMKLLNLDMEHKTLNMNHQTLNGKHDVKMMPKRSGKFDTARAFTIGTRP